MSSMHRKMLPSLHGHLLYVSVYAKRSCEPEDACVLKGFQFTKNGFTVCNPLSRTTFQIAQSFEQPSVNTTLSLCRYTVPVK